MAALVFGNVGNVGSVGSIGAGSVGVGSVGCIGSICGGSVGVCIALKRPVWGLAPVPFFC